MGEAGGRGGASPGLSNPLVAGMGCGASAGESRPDDLGSRGGRVGTGTGPGSGEVGS